MCLQDRSLDTDTVGQGSELPSRGARDASLALPGQGIGKGQQGSLRGPWYVRGGGRQVALDLHCQCVKVSKGGWRGWV